MFKRSILFLGLLLFTASCGRGTTSPAPARPPAASALPVQATFTPETALTATPSSEAAEAAPPHAQSNLPLPIPALALATDPFDSRAVYALLANHELYRTIDGGRNWQRLPFPARQADFDPAQAGGWLEPDPGDLRFSPYHLGHLFLRAGGVLYASQDGGETWLALIEDVTTWFVDDEVTRLYAWRTGKSPGLYRSGDGGQSWQFVHPGEQPEEAERALFQPEEVISLVIGGISDAELFASTAGSVFRSPDGGENWWEQPLDGLPAQPQRIHLFKARSFGADLYALAQTSAGPFLARFDRGWVSPDQDHWEILGLDGSSGLAAFATPGASGLFGIFTLLVDPFTAEQLYLGTASGLLFSPDGGHSWERYGQFETGSILRLALTQGFEPAVYAGTEAGVAVARLVERTASEPELPAFDERVQLELVAQAGGSLGPYVASGDLAYAALGPYLAAIDFGKAPASPQVAWRSPALAAEIRALALDGARLFVITRDGWLHRYDRADPRQPVLGASVPISPETSSLNVRGDLAALVESRCRGSRCQARLLTVDLSPPFEARVTGSFDLPGPSRGLYLAGSLIIVAYNYGLLAVDVSSGPAGPQQVAQYIRGPVRHAEFAAPYA